MASRFHIGIDIGGTFTDCVLIGDPAGDGTATYRTAKALSTQGDPADGVLAGLTGVCRAWPPRSTSTSRSRRRGLRLGTEIIRSGDDPAADMVLAGGVLAGLAS